MELFIFDRDGTVIGELGNYKANHPRLIRSPQDQKLIRSVARFIQKQTCVFLVSNQGGVHGTSRYKTIWDVQMEFAYLHTLLPSIKGSLFCTDNQGKRCHFVTERNDLIVDWGKQQFPELVGKFRKPNGGMLTTLMSRHPLRDVTYIGDQSTDEQAAKDAGCHFIYVENFIKSL